MEGALLAGKFPSVVSSISENAGEKDKHATAPRVPRAVPLLGRQRAGQAEVEPRGIVIAAHDAVQVVAGDRKNVPRAGREVEQFLTEIFRIHKNARGVLVDGEYHSA